MIPTLLARAVVALLLVVFVGAPLVLVVSIIHHLYHRRATYKR